MVIGQSRSASNLVHVNAWQARVRFDRLITDVKPKPGTGPLDSLGHLSTDFLDVALAHEHPDKT